MSAQPVVIITVTCGCGLVIGEWENSIAEKYPFSCEVCDDTRRNSYPWTLTTRIESRPATAGAQCQVCQGTGQVWTAEEDGTGAWWMACTACDTPVPPLAGDPDAEAPF